MGDDAENRLKYYLTIEENDTHFLDELMAWVHLRVAKDGSTIWLTGFNASQIESVEVKVIPSKAIYYEKDNQLFPISSILPKMKAPTSLLWTPIERAIQVSVNNFNHNYFGQDEKLKVKLVKSEVERVSSVLLVNLDSLEEYVRKAPKVRLDRLKWVSINNRSALLFGTPLLPLMGETYHVIHNAVIPAGYEFEFHLLVKEIHLMLDPTSSQWFVWNSMAEFFKVPMEDVRPLSRGSVRKTLDTIGIVKRE